MHLSRGCRKNAPHGRCCSAAAGHRMTVTKQTSGHCCMQVSAQDCSQGRSSLDSVACKCPQVKGLAPGCSSWRCRSAAESGCPAAHHTSPCCPGAAARQGCCCWGGQPCDARDPCQEDRARVHCMHSKMGRQGAGEVASPEHSRFSTGLQSLHKGFLRFKLLIPNVEGMMGIRS